MSRMRAPTNIRKWSRLRAATFLVLGGMSLAGFAIASDAGKSAAWVLVLGIVCLILGYQEQVGLLKDRIKRLEKGVDAFLGSRQRRAEEYWTKAKGPGSKEVAESLHGIALAKSDLGSHAEAEALYRRALDIWEKALGPESEEVAGCLTNLAISCEDQGKLGEAEPLFRQALAIREKVLGAEHPEVAFSLSNLVSNNHGRGNYPEAMRLHQRVISIWEDKLGPEHPDLAPHLEYHAGLLRRMGRGSEAKDMEARVRAIRGKQRMAKP
jgi:tetratricopeptide (TPR) repeat protein